MESKSGEENAEKSPTTAAVWESSAKIVGEAVKIVAGLSLGGGFLLLTIYCLQIGYFPPLSVPAVSGFLFAIAASGASILLGLIGVLLLPGALLMTVFRDRYVANRPVPSDNTLGSAIAIFLIICTGLAVLFLGALPSVGVGVSVALGACVTFLIVNSHKNHTKQTTSPKTPEQAGSETGSPTDEAANKSKKRADKKSAKKSSKPSISFRERSRGIIDWAIVSLALAVYSVAALPLSLLVINCPTNNWTPMVLIGAFVVLICGSIGVSVSRFALQGAQSLYVPLLLTGCLLLIGFGLYPSLLGQFFSRLGLGSIEKQSVFMSTKGAAISAASGIRVSPVSIEENVFASEPVTIYLRIGDTFVFGLDPRPDNWMAPQPKIVIVPAGEVFGTASQGSASGGIDQFPATEAAILDTIKQADSAPPASATATEHFAKHEQPKSSVVFSVITDEPLDQRLSVPRLLSATVQKLAPDATLYLPQLDGTLPSLSDDLTIEMSAFFAENSKALVIMMGTLPAADSATVRIGGNPGISKPFLSALEISLRNHDIANIWKDSKTEAIAARVANALATKSNGSLEAKNIRVIFCRFNATLLAPQLGPDSLHRYAKLFAALSEFYQGVETETPP